MEIIKEAFIEGRETTVSYDNSTAKQNQIKMDVILANQNILNGKIFNSKYPIQRICPLTGKVLQTYASRLNAACWIAEHVLKRPDKNPVSITGNMHMCILGGWKSYGYYWKYIDVETMINENKVNHGAKVVIGMHHKYDLLSSILPFASITQASKHSGISEKKLRKMLSSGEVYNNWKFMPKNDSVTEIVFDSIQMAADHFNLGYSTTRRMIANGSMINNYKIKLKSLPVNKTKYDVYKGKAKLGSFKYMEEVAAIVGTNRKNIKTALTTKNKIGDYRIEAVNAIEFK